MGVTSRCLDFEDAIVNGQKRDIEGSSSKIVDNDLTFVTGAVKTVRDSGGRWLVHDSKDVQTGNGAGILSSLPLVVVEVCWYGDDGVDHLFSEVALCDFLHLSKYHCGDFLGGEGPVLSLDRDGDCGLVILVGDSKREVLDVTLYVFVREFASNESPAQAVSQVFRDKQA